LLKKALESIYHHQTVKPNEIVIVKDGPLNKQLHDVITVFIQDLKESFNFTSIKVVDLKNNVGLGMALREGIQYCDYPYIARMDADDISLPNRFEKQTKFLEENDVDLLGGHISEFVEDELLIKHTRSVPTEMSSIVKFAKLRNPVNHASVMFKKSSILNVGSYESMFGFEDYYLWVKLILNGYKIHNMPDILVNFRLGDGFTARRSGFKYVKHELRFWQSVYQIGFLSSLEYIKAVLIRIPLRLLPSGLLKQVYEKMRR
jgi:glycosyltransferase involved in cell wall biosynthesis